MILSWEKYDNNHTINCFIEFFDSGRNQVKTINITSWNDQKPTLNFLLESITKRSHRYLFFAAYNCICIFETLHASERTYSIIARITLFCAILWTAIMYGEYFINTTLFVIRTTKFWVEAGGSIPQSHWAWISPNVVRIVIRSAFALIRSAFEVHS